MRPVAETRVITADPEKFDPACLGPAVDALREGALVVIPTETVYGIAVNLEKPESVRRLHELRQTPSDKPVTVHIGERDALRKVVPPPVPPAAQRLIQKFWPGPLTIVFPTADARGVGVRFPSHRLACEIVRRAGVRVGAPSAQLPDHRPAVTGQEAVGAYRGKVEVIVDAGPTRHRGPSTVVRVEGSRAEVLRVGAVPAEMIREVNVLSILFVCTGNTCRSPMAEAMARKMLADRLGVKESDVESRGYRVVSAGTAAGHGGAATEEAEQVVRLYGADLSRHESRPVSVAMVEEADHVYVMTGRHRKVLVEWMPEHSAKIQLLDPSGRDIDDPVGGPIEVYRDCVRQIHESLKARLKEIP
jgi:tRNA threonylcarbamoyl adenosine modification protein (Sua5/YciO/YrdC/YwlC family)